MRRPWTTGGGGVSRGGAVGPKIKENKDINCSEINYRCREGGEGDCVLRIS